MKRKTIPLRLTSTQIKELDRCTKKFKLNSRNSYIEKKLFDLDMNEHPICDERFLKSGIVAEDFR